jgi:hypothetical protein
MFLFSFSFFVFSTFFFSISNRNYIIKCYLFKGVIFPSFTLKLMLLFIIMNMSNSRVYFMRQNVSAPGGKVSTPTEYAVMQGRSSAPCSVARAHCDPSAPIIGRLRPSCTVRAMSLVVLTHCHPFAPIGIPFVPSCIPFVPSRVPSSPSHLPSVRTGTSLRPFAFRLHVPEEVRARRLRSMHAWVHYKRQSTTAREATISLCFKAWNSVLSSLRETTCVDMALVGC